MYNWNDFCKDYDERFGKPPGARMKQNDAVMNIVESDLTESICHATGISGNCGPDCEAYVAGSECDET